MKIEENTDYELNKKHAKLIGLFITVLLIGLIIMIVLVGKAINVANQDLESERLSQGIVSEIRTPGENQLEPKDLCQLEVVHCDDEIVEKEITEEIPK